MKWHDYPPMVFDYERLFENDFLKYGWPLKSSPKEAADKVIAIFERKDSPVYINIKAQVQGEANWCLDRRPYYNIWPSVIHPFTNVDLNKVKCSDIRLPLPRLVIRFPQGHELHKARSIFVMETMSKDNANRALLMVINNAEFFPAHNFMHVHTVNSIVLHDDQTINDRLQWCKDNPGNDDPLDYQMIDSCMKLVCAICLLGDNPDLIEQSPIESDRKKWEITRSRAICQG